MSNDCLPTPQKSDTLLIATPEMGGGSWVCIHEFVKIVFPHLQTIVTTLGLPKEKPDGMIVFKIPYPSYQKMDQNISSNVLFVALYKLPLFLMLTIVSLIYRPGTIIGNGFITSIGCIIPAKIIRARIIAAFHGHVLHTIGPSTRHAIRFLCNSFDLVTVNSIGSKDDASMLIDPSKILVIEHSADDIFFQRRDRDALREKMSLKDKFVILYVGRMDVEKSFDALLSAFKNLSGVNDIVLFIVGTGNLEGRVRLMEKESINIKYFGYLTDRQQLAELYTVADVVWSYADETYLAKPAIESLASGTPIIIPDKPAIYRKAKAGIRIDPKLVPKDIGWIVDTSDISEIVQLISSIKAKSIMLRQMRANCVRYAKINHSPESLRKAVADLHGIVLDKH
jgi:glycosyltransferase involved in cell wall biosynthesis